MTKKMLLIAAMVFALMFAFQACSDDDDDTTDDGNDDVAEDGDEPATEDGDDPVAEDGDEPVEDGDEPVEDGDEPAQWTAPTEPPDCELEYVDFTTKVYEFGADPTTPEAFPAGVTVYVLYNANGAKVDMEPSVSDAEGTVVFTQIPVCAGVGKVAFLAAGQEGVYIDTYKFQMVPAQEETIYIVPQSTYYMAPAAAGLTLEPGTAVVAGAVYHLGEETQTPIGCATVVPDPDSGDTRYFNADGLPTKLENQDSTYAGNGLYIMANLAPGNTVFSALVDGTEIGQTQLVGFPDSIAIANIYVVGGDNPGCALEE